MWPSSSNDNDKNNNTGNISDVSSDLEHSIKNLSGWVDATSQLWTSLTTPGIKNSVSGLAKVIGRDPNADLAWPVPSTEQYSSCIDRNGRSIWTEDGFWRCILKNGKVPNHLKEQFPDYTSFLKYQRNLLQERQRGAVQQRPTASLWAGFPGEEKPRLITQEEAQGKRIVSQREKSHTVSLDNGDLETRTELIQYFDDGTALVQSKKNSGPGSSSGWFWN